jgi:hypothetical protein
VAWQHNPFSQFKTKLSQPRSSVRPSRQGSFETLSEAALEAQSTASLNTAQSGIRRSQSQAHGFNARAVAKVVALYVFCAFFVNGRSCITHQWGSHCTCVSTTSSLPNPSLRLQPVQLWAGCWSMQKHCQRCPS